jgi:hypothetical protein
MDMLVALPVTLIALVVAIVGTAYEMRTALQPANCPECPHCRGAAIEREAQQRDLQDQFARRNGLDDGDDDRRIG